MPTEHPARGIQVAETEWCDDEVAPAVSRVTDSENSPSEIDQFVPDAEQAPTAPNAVLLRALALQARTATDTLPVDTSNTRLIPLHQRQSLPHPSKDRDRVFKYEGLKSSYQLLFLFKALTFAKLKREYTGTPSVIAHVTINLTREYSAELDRGVKSPAGATSRFLKRRFDKLDADHQFFVVMEHSGDRAYHAHVVLQIRADVIQDVEAVLRSGYKNKIKSDRGVDVQLGYRDKHSAKPGTPEFELLELEQEQGCSGGRQFRQTPTGGYFYRVRPVDGGIAEYLAKELHKPFRRHSTSRKWSASDSLTKAAERLYQAAYDLQQSAE